MGALNKAETGDLQTVEKLLDYILKHGFKPNEVGINKNQEDLQKAINLGRRRVHTIVTMKGYQPKV